MNYLTNKYAIWWAVLAVTAAMSFACSQDDTVSPKPSLSSAISYFRVTFTTPPPTSADTRPEYDGEVPLEFDIEAIGYDGQPASDYNSVVKIKIDTGLIVDSLAHVSVDAGKTFATTNIIDGKGEGLGFTVKWGYDKARIIVEEILSDTWDPYNRISHDIPGVAVGASDVVYFCRPTVANMQKIMRYTYDQEQNEAALNNRSVVITEGKLVVTGYTRDGFFVTDVEEPDQAYASAYVYTWSSPYVEVCSEMRYFSGMVSDFYGFTEISSFPDWQVKRDLKCDTMEEMADVGIVPKELTATMFANAPVDVEPWEAALVEVKNICVSTMNESQKESFLTYGQWPAGFSCGSNDFVVVTQDAAPNFNPLEHGGETIGLVRGNLKQHFSAGYILVPRFAEDFVQ